MRTADTKTPQPQQSSPAPQQSGDDYSILIAKQRQMAESAMEGEERRHAREAAEAQLRATAEAEKRKREDMLRLSRIEREQKSELERITTAAREKQKKALAAQHATIDELVRSPALSVRPVRTLKEDMKGAGKNISMVSIAIKEDERRREKSVVATEEAKKNSTFAIVSAILIFAGLGAGGWAVYTLYFANSFTPEEVVQTYRAPAIFAEKTNIVPIGRLQDTQLIALLRNEVRNLNAPLSNIEEVLMVEAEGATERASLQRFATILRLRAPDILVRNMESNFMYGVHSAPTNAGFLILFPQARDRAFAGMLAWEPSMTRDLYAILSGLSPDADLETALWTDAVIRNVNTRVVRNADGRIALLYAFFDQKTLIITASEDTFTEILTRLTTPRPAR